MVAKINGSPFEELPPFINPPVTPFRLQIPPTRVLVRVAVRCYQSHRGNVRWFVRRVAIRDMLLKPQNGGVEGESFPFS